MRIAVIGHLCQDVIHLPDKSGIERQTQSYGGIFWTVATLANLLSPNDRVHAIFGVSESEYDALLDRLSRYNNVNTGCIFVFPKPPNLVHLFYSQDGTNRVECSRDISDPIPFSSIKPHVDVDGVLINMVSGFDITLETLDYIRMYVRDRGVPIHFDFHSLTLGIDTEYRRFRRPVSDWRRWCFMLNSIQMSRDEAAGLTPEKLNDSSLADQMMSLMVNALVVTRDKHGAVLFQREIKNLTRRDFSGIPTAAVDATGCGDVFGAAFFSEYLRSRDYIRSVDFANQVAAAKTTFSGVDGLDGISDLIGVKTS